jgi:hypothetical protein
LFPENGNSAFHRYASTHFTDYTLHRNPEDYNAYLQLREYLSAVTTETRVIQEV